MAADLLALADGWLAQEAMVVLERASRSPEPQWPPGLRRVKDRRYGETRVWQAPLVRSGRRLRPPSSRSNDLHHHPHHRAPPEEPP